MVAHVLCIPRGLENPKRSRSLAHHVGNGGARRIAVVVAITGQRGDMLHEFLELRSLVVQLQALLQLLLLQALLFLYFRLLLLLVLGLSAGQ